MKTRLHYNFRKFYTLFFFTFEGPFLHKNIENYISYLHWEEDKITQIELLFLSCNFKKNENENIFM